MSPERALAGAVRDAVRANAALKALLGDPVRLFDEPPEESLFPYATLGRSETRAADSSAVDGLEHILSLHVWSRYGGRSEVLDIIGALRSVLHNAALDVAGRRLVFVFVSFADVFRSGDGRTTHGVLRLRAMTEAEV